jgi:lipopolysaccharide export system protein LptA
MLSLSRTQRLAMRGVLVAVLVGAAALGVSSPRAAHADPLAEIAGETLDVRADKLDVDIDKGRALLVGNVSTKLGELEVLCPKVDIRYDEAPKVRWARGSGGIKASLKGIEATAETVELDVARRVVKLQGAVRLSRGRGWVQAERATIDVATRKVTLHEVKGSIPVEPPAR